MTQRLRIRLLASDENTPRARAELARAGELCDADADVTVIDALPYEAAPGETAVLLCDAPEHADARAAIEAGAIAVAVQREFRDGELAAAVDRAALIGRLRREQDALRVEMTRRIDALAILDEVFHAASDVSTHGEILEVVMGALLRILPFDVGAALLASDEIDANVLHLHCPTACDEAKLGHARDLCIELYGKLAGRPVDERTLVVDLHGQHLGGATSAAEIASTIHVPLSLAGATIGVIQLGAYRANAFSREDAALLEFLATRASDAIVRLAARLFGERRRLGLMVESMADGVLMTDPGSEVVLINPSARRMLGIHEDERVTRQYLKERLGFYPFDLVNARAQPPSADGQGLVREELRIGDNVLHSIVSPVLDSVGKLVGVVVVLRDITEAKELDRRKDEFVSVVSHELRTPLTSVTGALDIVLKEYVGTISDKQRRYLQMARDSCARLNVIVDDLLDVARSERGRMPMRFRPIALDELSSETVERYRGAAEAKDVDLRLTLETSDIRIVGDPDRLTQVLNNLLSNAIKFTPQGGRIDVEVFGPSVASSHVGVSVYNNGEPIPEQSRERVFDKFEQIQESSTRRVGGTGLGLAISRAIVEAHGGRIWVDARLEGTKFVFTLPAAPTTELEQSPLPEVESDDEEAGDDTGTILLVCTDDYTTFILKGVLMEARHSVLVARDTYQAISMARQHRPALVVIDAPSIQQDWPTLIEIVEHDPDTKKAAILVVDVAGNRDAALAAGAAEVLAKPIDADDFRRTCHRLIRDAAHSAAARVLVVDDDPSIRMICREVLAAAGYNVREAATGLVALEEAKRFRPDLMLLDIMMPDLDGFQTAQRFRADASGSLTPIIFLSARGETADKVRAFRIGAEDYIVKPFDASELVARVEKALRRRMRELQASPTTQLPGADAIEAEIERRLADDAEHAFCYLDLDNLKAFNDYYGYAKADGVIRQTGDLIREVVARDGTPDDFIGHIAGDDFVFVTSPAAVDRVCGAICDTFDRLVPLYYNRDDRERGYIETKDRYGIEREFPIMTLSIAAVTSSAGPIDSFGALSAAAAAGKKLAKAAHGSSYVCNGELRKGRYERPPDAPRTGIVVS